jgi:hypothetical protein
VDLPESERLRRNEAATTAHACVLRFLIAGLLPDPTKRAAMRDRMCEAMEGFYATEKLNPGGHEFLQATLHEIEELFRDIPDNPGATAESPQES